MRNGKWSRIWELFFEWSLCLELKGAALYLEPALINVYTHTLIQYLRPGLHLVLLWIISRFSLTVLILTYGCKKLPYGYSVHKFLTPQISSSPPGFQTGVIPIPILTCLWSRHWTWQGFIHTCHLGDMIQSAVRLPSFFPWPLTSSYIGLAMVKTGQGSLSISKPMWLGWSSQAFLLVAV